ncbi:trypsin-like peptidase domain-containing protein [Nocardioides caldifontis]|uniref:trypsin-like peptidase domain-containing protein n=1 Tax=Nocardioides caldifontis TaxID=2588938 RepID=UPI0011DFAC97|nr:trypsin-like peptidase domain-containing protein [Nocardioides caldifontis]
MASRARTTAASIFATALATAAFVAGPADAAQPSSAVRAAWAPAASAKIHPGVQMYTNGAQCTANFVFTDSASNVYVGYAAHCAGTGEATDTNGCDAGSLPLGTKVEFVENGNLLTAGTTVGTGTLAYSSWLSMKQAGTTDENTCAYNDFALVKVDAAHVGKVNPSVPFFGGPTAVNSDGAPAGEKVYSFGNSSLRAGVELLSPKVGASLGTSGGGWTHPVYTLTPGVPGDSGSGFLDAEGKALGTLSTLALAPLPASNGVGDLSRELRFAQQHSGISGLQLVPGTEPFEPVL